MTVLIVSVYLKTSDEAGNTTFHHHIRNILLYTSSDSIQFKVVIVNEKNIYIKKKKKITH